MPGERTMDRRAEPPRSLLLRCPLSRPRLAARGPAERLRRTPFGASGIACTTRMVLSVSNLSD